MENCISLVKCNISRSSDLIVTRLISILSCVSKSICLFQLAACRNDSRDRQTDAPILAFYSNLRLLMKIGKNRRKIRLETKINNFQICSKYSQHHGTRIAILVREKPNVAQIIVDENELEVNSIYIRMYAALFLRRYLN